MAGADHAAFASTTPQDGHVPTALPVALAGVYPASAMFQSTPALPTTAMGASMGSPEPCKKNDDKFSASPAHTRALINFMRQLHLEQYTDDMIKQGYDDLDFMSSMPKRDLHYVAKLVKMLPGHAVKFVASMTRRLASMSTAPKAFDEASASTDRSAPEGSYVVCIVDRSASMFDMGSAVKHGFNEFLQEQKAFPGDCMATVVRFDNKVEVVHHGVNLKDIPPATDATFEPRGMTALYDGIGYTIEMVKDKIATLSIKPKRVMVLVLTDGEENSSRKYSHAVVMKKIVHCEQTLKWSFVFIGANQDAIATGTQLGFRRDSCLTFTPSIKHQRQTWSNVSANISRQRRGGSSNWTRRERASSQNQSQSQLQIPDCLGLNIDPIPNPHAPQTTTITTTTTATPMVPDVQ